MSEPSESEVILSLGGGVQSSTLALMALRGDLPPGFRRPRAAVFADTGFEPAQVYAHLRWLIDTLGRSSFPEFSLFAIFAQPSPWKERAAPPDIATTARIGELFMGPFVLPFEIASLLLTAGMIGAIVIARED